MIRTMSSCELSQMKKQSDQFLVSSDYISRLMEDMHILHSGNWHSSQSLLYAMYFYRHGLNMSCVKVYFNFDHPNEHVEPFP